MGSEAERHAAVAEGPGSGAAGLLRLAGALTDGVVAVDGELVIRFANTPAARLLGLARGAVGEPLREPILRELALQVLEGGQGGPVRTASGTVEAHGTVADDGSTALLLLVDLSGREARGSREHAVAEFLTNAAHELRTPLTAITGAIEVLQAGAKHDEAARELFLGHIERECARLRRVTRAMLTLARAQALEEEPPLELVPIHETLEAVLEALPPASAARVEVDCPPELAALADRELLEQALGALVQNAADYAGSGTIELAARPLPDGRLAVEVADRGPGLPPELVERVGERFLGGAEGSGLGLALVHQVARTVGGSLDFDSRPGGGTVARLSLRAVRLTHP
jgi:signal transduction histidine kinase